jgi:hypothetical protein
MCVTGLTRFLSARGVSGGKILSFRIDNVTLISFFFVGMVEEEA